MGILSLKVRVGELGDDSGALAGIVRRSGKADLSEGIGLDEAFTDKGLEDGPVGVRRPFGVARNIPAAVGIAPLGGGLDTIEVVSEAHLLGVLRDIGFSEDSGRDGKDDARCRRFPGFQRQHCRRGKSGEKGLQLMPIERSS